MLCLLRRILLRYKRGNAAREHLPRLWKSRWGRRGRREGGDPTHSPPPARESLSKVSKVSIFLDSIIFLRFLFLKIRGRTFLSPRLLPSSFLLLLSFFFLSEIPCRFEKGGRRSDERREEGWREKETRNGGRLCHISSLRGWQPVGQEGT